MWTIKIYTDEWHEIQNDSLKVINPVLTEKLNGCGSLTYSVAKDDSYYDSYERFKTKVMAIENGSVLFAGRLLETSKDFYNTLKLTFEGDMAMLNDIQYPPYDFSGSIAEFFENVLSYYNSKCASGNTIQKGNITVTDKNNYIVRSNQDYSSCWETMSKKLVDLCGGYLKLRTVITNNEIYRYLDYLENPGTESTQKIEFGENILDVNQELTGEDIVTVLIPFGAEDETTGERIDITSVNPTGKNFIVSKNYAKYGLIEEVHYWDDVTLPENLYTKAVAYLQEHDTSGTTIKVNAVDLHAVDVDIQRFNIGDTVQVISKPHDIDTYMLITERTKNLNDVSKDTITLGNEEKTFTSSVDKNNYGVVKVEGDAISEVDILYGNSDSTDVEPTEWSTTAEIISGKYLWQKTKTIYVSGSISYSSPSCIGGKGTDGKGISSIIEEYYLSISNTEQTGGEWSATPVTWESGKYIWTRSHLYWSDSTDTTTTPVLANSLNDMGEKIVTIDGKIPSDDHIKTLAEQQTDILLGGNGGYFEVLYEDEDNPTKPTGFRIMDSESSGSATNIILMNKNGIGFSTNGITGPFYNAWTIDGKLSASYIATGVLQDSQGNFVLDLDTGKLTVGKLTLDTPDLIFGDVDNQYIEVTTTSDKTGVLFDGTGQIVMTPEGTFDLQNLVDGTLYNELKLSYSGSTKTTSIYNKNSSADNNANTITLNSTDSVNSANTYNYKLGSSLWANYLSMSSNGTLNNCYLKNAQVDNVYDANYISMFCATTGGNIGNYAKIYNNLYGGSRTANVLEMHSNQNNNIVDFMNYHISYNQVVNWMRICSSSSSNFAWIANKNYDGSNLYWSNDLQMNAYSGSNETIIRNYVSGTNRQANVLKLTGQGNTGQNTIYINNYNDDEETISNQFSMVKGYLWNSNSISMWCKSSGTYMARISLSTSGGVSISTQDRDDDSHKSAGISLATYDDEGDSKTWFTLSNGNVYAGGTHFYWNGSQKW